MDEFLGDWDYYPDDEDEAGVDFYEDQPVIPIREGAGLADIYEECLEPTFYSAADQIIWLLCCCIVFRIFSQLLPVPRPLSHVMSIVCGLVGVFSTIGSTAIYTTVFATSTYWCLILCAKQMYADKSYRFVSFLLLIYLVIREYVNVIPESWEQVRGIQMIMVLKSLSLCYEISIGERKGPPPFLDYLGYIFCPATVVFGPWIPFNVYSRLFDARKWSLGWVIEVFATGLRSFLSLGVSSCMVYWTFLGISSSWLLAARDALSVRFSHYFISYISETTSVLSGFSSDSNNEVTTPWKIELPRSLVEVVVHWNMPMHRWLKVHVFRPASHLGAFRAVFLTFIVSSMLHGMNFSLTMVLLSLGLYTYVEYSLREKLSSIFDACIRSRRCPSECQHQNKADQFLVRLVNIGLGFWAYFHLTYLGVMMDKNHSEYSDEEMSNGVIKNMLHDLQKWDNLNFASHWTMLAVYLGSLVI